ncbi:MAG: long-chain fatty acid--CoA ligase [Gemmatimonadaceae bacterium]|nr:long-chain fatty acid--CoA ligase [Gemmatimonadaceae bacterium]
MTAESVPLVRQFLSRAAHTPLALAFAVYPAGASRATADLSWGEWADASRAIAAQLLQAGIGPGDRVMVLAGNRPLWPIADLAIQMVGAIGVGVYPTSTPAQVEAMVMDSGTALALVAGATHRRTLQYARRAVGRALPIIADAPENEFPPAAGDVVTGDSSWEEWQRRGAASLASDATLRAALEARISAVALDDLAALIYTSGSTGKPKGACISHRYLAASAESIADVLALTSADRTLSFLPFSHAAERVFGQCTRIVAGLPTALIEDPADVFVVARSFEPTMLGGLPRIFERLYEAVEVARRDGTDPRTAITDRIGPRCRFATSGGAAMPSHIAAELAALGLPILGAYGQTEHLCVAMNRPGHFRFDAVGVPMPGTTVRIADDGELLVAKSALTFSGYWGDAHATRAAFTDDGEWLRTGDRAALDADGMLRITGRVKELIALSTGRKIAPIPIEAALVSSPFIAHAVCYGEGRKYLTALLSLRRPVVEAWARTAGLALAWPDLVAHPRWQAMLHDVVSQVNADLARTDRVQRFTVIAHELTVEAGELTPTHKLVRQVIAARYAESFDALYGESSA